jgi:hypothetical protein
MSLLGLIYLNLGLYIEFQGSYYLNYYQFIDFNWYEGVKELNQSLIINPSRDPSLVLSSRLKGGEINTEINEFKNFFISTVNYFSGQVKLFIDLTEGNTNQLLKKQSYSQQLLFSIYMMFLFYQLTALLSYHFFCFLGPGLLKQSRVKLFQGLQMLFLTLLLHFLTLPYVITIFEELQIESLDSELFFSAPFNLLNSWVRCFYFLLIVLTLLLFFLSYVLPYAAAPRESIGPRSASLPTADLAAPERACEQAAGAGSALA